MLVSYICGGSLRYLGVLCFIVPPHQVTRTNTERTDSAPTAFSTRLNLIITCVIRY